MKAVVIALIVLVVCLVSVGITWSFGLGDSGAILVGLALGAAGGVGVLGVIDS